MTLQRRDYKARLGQIKKTKSKLLPIRCGCPRILKLVVRTYKSGREEWGYACDCGRYFKAHGLLSPGR